MRSLCERGHELWGLWSRSMAWDQGPYPETEDCIRSLELADAARTIRDENIDCIYSLFQVYDRRMWGPSAPGVEHGIWTLLRSLLLDRQRGLFDVPIVRHWGFDVHELDLDVAHALDGHIFCNREKLAYWTKPAREGGCGLDVFGECEVVEFFDGDQPKLEFMSDNFGEKLSDRDGEIHTVCVGRPFHLDYVGLARHGIHLHIYGNGVHEVARMIAPDLSPRHARRNAALLHRYLHIHPPLQPVRASREDLPRFKERWVPEFSRYDAGWSYIGSPYPWEALDDRAAIPNRLGTYLLAGLPIITDRKPGYYRYEEPKRRGVAVELVDGDYAALRAVLEKEIRTREKTGRAREERAGYSFDATIEPLIGTLERARASYYTRPPAERTRFSRRSPRGTVRFRVRPPARRFVRGIVRAPRLGQVLRLGKEANARGTRPQRVAALERFADSSRRCDAGKLRGVGDRVEWNMPGLRHHPWALVRGLPRAWKQWTFGPIPRGERRRLFRACLETGGARLGGIVRAPELWRRVRAGEIDRLACFSSKDFGLAHFLAEELGTPLDEILARGTQYFGEFAFELLAVVPYAYWLHDQGRLEFTVSTADTRCLYYFSPHHEERQVARRAVAITEYPVGEKGRLFYDPLTFPVSLDTRRWLPPPYREIYRDARLVFDKPTCVVCNKTSEERYLLRGKSVNTMDIGLTLAVIEKLRTRYQVVYNRPRSADIVGDHQTICEVGDIEAVRWAFPEVRTIQELHAAHPDLTFNELQLRLFAGCERFVSVLGGSSYLASWFGGTNVVYARRGWEVACHAYDNWFDRFSGARIVAAATPRALLDAVQRELL